MNPTWLVLGPCEPPSDDEWRRPHQNILSDLVFGEISTKETSLALQRALSSHKGGGKQPESQLNFAACGFVRNCRLMSAARQRVSSFLKGERSWEKEEQRLPPQECLLLGMCEIVVFLNKLSGCILREVTRLDGLLRWC